MKTDTDIKTEIDTLKAMKPKVLQRSAFGDDHHAAIDAQIMVLEKRLSHDSIYDKFEASGDRDMDHDEGRGDNVLDGALNAYRWMRDEDEAEAPSSEWSDLQG